MIKISRIYRGFIEDPVFYGTESDALVVLGDRYHFDLRVGYMIISLVDG